MEQKGTGLMQEQQRDEMEIDLMELFSVVWHNLLLIIEIGLCVGALAFLFSSLLVPKQYVSTTKVYILNRQSDSVNVTYSDLQSGATLTKDYKELIKSLPVMEKVVAQLNLDISPEKLADKITVDSPADTRIIEISVSDTDPYMANAMANAVRIAASAQISQVMDIEAVNIVQKASYPDHASSPSVMKNTMLGCILGAILTIAVLFVLYLLDDTIKTPDDVEKVLGMSVLGTIPILKGEEGKKKKIGKRGRHKG